MVRVNAAVLVVVMLIVSNLPGVAWANTGIGWGQTAPFALVQTQPSDDFVPVSQLPDTEQLPAAPLLIGAYIVVWLAILVYLLSLWRRMAAVDREIADLERRVSEARRS